MTEKNEKNITSINFGSSLSLCASVADFSLSEVS